MRKKTKFIVYQIIAPSLIVAISVTCAVVFNDYTWGLASLLFGFFNAYYMALGKWVNYIFGILFSVTYSITCYVNGLYGFGIFTILVYTPIQIFGIIKWFKKQEDNEVLINSLSVKTAIWLTIAVCTGSFLIGFLLDLIPSQNLSYLDASSQIINICGLVLVGFRYREAWIVWLANNLIDLAIWIINLINKTQYSELMFITAVMYLVMNIYGIINWIIIERKQKRT